MPGHTKYPPPRLLDAPPDLARLVEEHVRAEGLRAIIDSNYAIRRWLTRHGARSGTIYVTDAHLVCCLHGGASVGPKARPLADKDRRVLHA